MMDMQWFGFVFYPISSYLFAVHLTEMMRIMWSMFIDVSILKEYVLFFFFWFFSSCLLILQLNLNLLRLNNNNNESISKSSIDDLFFRGIFSFEFFFFLFQVARKLKIHCCETVKIINLSSNSAIHNQPTNIIKTW